MIKKLFILFVLSQTIIKAQVLYTERFNNVSLITGTYSANSIVQSYQYNDVTNGIMAINNNNAIADTLTGNYPFRAINQKRKAWMTYKAINQLDTFAVSTSWKKPTGNADDWLITPTINNIAANSVLTWEAFAPDINNADGYEVYVSTTTSTTPVVSDFTSSNRIAFVANEKNVWTTRGVSLAAYAGQNIRIAFKNNSNNKYQLWLDDIQVKNISSSFDGTTISNETYPYSIINVNNTIICTFKNNGYSPLSSATLNYKIGNNAVISQLENFTFPLHYLDTKQITFGLPFNSSLAGYSVIKIWATALNGQADQFTANDTIYGSITISSSAVAKKVLLETFTGAWCGWCPDGFTKLQNVVSTNTNVIAVALHENDNMSIANGMVLINDYTTSFPTATVDQFYFPANETMAIDKMNWSNYVTQRQTMSTPASVTITGVSYNNSTREISANVEANFVGDVKGDYRLNFYIKENNVFGPVADVSDNNWNQYSYLYNASSSPYYQLGSLLIGGSSSITYLLNANDYKHQYVVNHIADGPYGVSGIIPSNGLTNGNTYSRAYTYTVPIATAGEFRYNINNMYLIGVVSEYNINTQKRAILNACEIKLTTDPETIVGLKVNESQQVDINLFPNPTNGNCNLNYTLDESQDVSIKIYNMLGEVVYTESQSIQPGNVVHHLNTAILNEGNYLISIMFKYNSVTKKLIVIK